MNFFEKLLTDGTGTSSKRFISLIGMLMFIVIIVVSFFGINIPELIVVTLATIILGNGALTLGGKNNNSEK